MTTLSHTAVGIIVVQYAIESGWLPQFGLTPYIIGVIFANIPDIDGLLSLRKLYDHHNTAKNMTHYPANWFFVLVFTAILAIPFHIPNFWIYLGVCAVNILLHFILDTFSIYGGIAWLGPWKKQKYSFIKIMPIIPDNNKQWVHWYMKHWVVYFEISLWIIATLIIVHQAKLIRML